jgi:co-chaperonin GroES (HSP10)
MIAVTDERFRSLAASLEIDPEELRIAIALARAPGGIARHVRPLPGRVLIRRCEPPEKIGSIYTPQSDDPMKVDTPMEGVVLAIGPGFPSELHVGDRIMFSKYYPGIEVKLDAGEHRILKEDDIVGVVLS